MMSDSRLPIGDKNFDYDNLPLDKAVDLFQHLSDTGKIWEMKNDYIIKLHSLVENGYVIMR
tara:strand:- start:4260 stop:4442 length:183 start_codon:yes stop_codon:yes gene_type:complete